MNLAVTFDFHGIHVSLTPDKSSKFSFPVVSLDEEQSNASVKLTEFSGLVSIAIDPSMFEQSNHAAIVKALSADASTNTGSEKKLQKKDEEEDPARKSRASLPSSKETKASPRSWESPTVGSFASRQHAFQNKSSSLEDDKKEETKAEEYSEGASDSPTSREMPQEEEEEEEQTSNVEDEEKKQTEDESEKSPLPPSPREQRATETASSRRLSHRDLSRVNRFRSRSMSRDEERTSSRMSQKTSSETGASHIIAKAKDFLNKYDMEKTPSPVRNSLRLTIPEEEQLPPQESEIDESPRGRSATAEPYGKRSQSVPRSQRLTSSQNTSVTRTGVLRNSSDSSLQKNEAHSVTWSDHNSTSTTPPSSSNLGEDEAAETSPSNSKNKVQPAKPFNRWKQAAVSRPPPPLDPSPVDSHHNRWNTSSIRQPQSSQDETNANPNQWTRPASSEQVETQNKSRWNQPNSTSRPPQQQQQSNDEAPMNRNRRNQETSSERNNAAESSIKRWNMPRQQYEASNDESPLNAREIEEQVQLEQQQNQWKQMRSQNQQQNDGAVPSDSRSGNDDSALTESEQQKPAAPLGIASRWKTNRNRPTSHHNDRQVETIGSSTGTSVRSNEPDEGSFPNSRSSNARSNNLQVVTSNRETTSSNSSPQSLNNRSRPVHDPRDGTQFTKGDSFKDKYMSQTRPSQPMSSHDYLQDDHEHHEEESKPQQPWQLEQQERQQRQQKQNNFVEKKIEPMEQIDRQKEEQTKVAEPWELEQELLRSEPKQWGQKEQPWQREQRLKKTTPPAHAKPMTSIVVTPSEEDERHALPGHTPLKGQISPLTHVSRGTHGSSGAAFDESKSRGARNDSPGFSNLLATHQMIHQNSYNNESSITEPEYGDYKDSNNFPEQYKEQGVQFNPENIGYNQEGEGNPYNEEEEDDYEQGEYEVDEEEEYNEDEYDGETLSTASSMVSEPSPQHHASGNGGLGNKVRDPPANVTQPSNRRPRDLVAQKAITLSQPSPSDRPISPMANPINPVPKPVPLALTSEIGCYLVYESDSSGKLRLYYSKTTILGAIGFWAPGSGGKKIQGFKFQQDGGRVDLIKGIMGGSANQKRFFMGWSQFVKAAKGYNGSVCKFPNHGGLEVDIYVLYGEDLALLDVDQGLCDVSNVDAVACVPKGKITFAGVKSMDMHRFLNTGNMAGAALKM